MKGAEVVVVVFCYGVVVELMFVVMVVIKVVLVGVKLCQYIVNAVYSGEGFVINGSVGSITDVSNVCGVHESVDLSLVAFLLWC